MNPFGQIVSLSLFLHAFIIGSNKMGLLTPKTFVVWRFGPTARKYFSLLIVAFVIGFMLAVAAAIILWSVVDPYSNAHIAEALFRTADREFWAPVHLWLQAASGQLLPLLIIPLLLTLLHHTIIRIMRKAGIFQRKDILPTPSVSVVPEQTAREDEGRTGTPAAPPHPNVFSNPAPYSG